MKKPAAAPIAVAQIAEQLQLVEQPVDLDTLVREGVLLKAGAWWSVPDVKRLPPHVSAKIAEIKNEGGRMLAKLRLPRKR